MSKVVEDLEYLLCASQCESEDASFFREYRDSVLDDEMIFVTNIIPMLNENVNVNVTMKITKIKAFFRDSVLDDEIVFVNNIIRYVNNIK